MTMTFALAIVRDFETLVRFYTETCWVHCALLNKINNNNLVLDFDNDTVVD